MTKPIAHITRGDIVECIQNGDAVVVNYKGEILYSHGDPHKESFIRSAAKPLQTLEVFKTGAADRYNFSQKELSIMCASHYGEEFHVETVKGIISKIGLQKEDLQCGEMYSMKPAVAHRQMKLAQEKSSFFSCCSGKHSGMLAICEAMGWDRNGYYREEHPVQQGMLETIAHMCQMNKNDIGIGIDGCGVPVFSMPIYNMALSYARFSKGNDPVYGKWCQTVYEAMASEPEMLAGTNGFCSDLTKAAKGKFVGKLGADGVYCIGIRDLGIGIALKIESGDIKCIPPVIMDILGKLKLIDPSIDEELKKYKCLPNRNHLRDKIGEIISTIDLQVYL